MSELFEAVITIADVDAAEKAFRTLVSPLNLRLIRLEERLYAVHRVAKRQERFDEVAMNDVAAQISNSCSAALAMFYDDRQGLNCCNLFRSGALVRSFDEEDELWVLLDDNGDPIVDGERFSNDQLDDDEEYDCIQSAIDAGLAALGIQDPPDISTLIDAFNDD